MDFKQLLNFLSSLKKNNNKEWFDKHKKEYDSLRADWILFVDELILSLQKFDAAIEGVEAKKSIFRINRDIRFSKDKSPYKTNFGASINPGGKNSALGGYYIHIEPGGCFVAGGMYMPEADNLGAVRQEIDYNFNQFRKIISNSDFKKHFGELSGEKLVRPPKGYDGDNPAIEFLRYKHFIAYHKLDPKVVAGKDFGKQLFVLFKAMYPLIRFLNSAVEK